MRCYINAIWRVHIDVDWPVIMLHRGFSEPMLHEWHSIFLNQYVTHCLSLCGIFLLHQTAMFIFVTPDSCWHCVNVLCLKPQHRLFPNKCYSIRVQFPSWSLKTRFTKHQQHKGFINWYWFHFCRQDVDKVYMSSIVQSSMCTFLGKTRHHCTAVHQCKS